MSDMDIERLKKLIQFEDSDLWDYKEELITLINEAIARQSATSEELAEAIEILRLNSELEKVMDENGDIDNQPYLNALDIAITALHKIGTNTVDVAWTEAYQSYESAGDEAVPYCPKCDADLEDDQKFCKDCGAELIWP